jgi:hypothetical protein
LQVDVRAKIAVCALALVLIAGSASAYESNDPGNCNGIDWDNKRPQVVQKVIARPRVQFYKSPYDDEFTATACPADTEACRRKSYLVTGDLVLAGKRRGAFTCAIYQSPIAKKPIWAKGWLPTSALTTVPPMSSPKLSDWIGTWLHPGGEITISRAHGRKLSIEGEMIVPAANDSHTGELRATVTPEKDTIAFVDDGSIRFDKAAEGECRVRMQRIGERLLVEDNSGCGGAAVTFTGFYRREKIEP